MESLKTDQVIDIRMAAANPSSIFTDDWSWPVEQVTYDDVTREIVEMLDRMHVDVGNDLDSLIPYQLIKSDLIKELVCFTCAMIDSSTAKKKQIRLVYGTAETLADMIARDQFSDYSIVGALRAVPSLGFGRGIRAWLAFQQRKFGRTQTARSATSSVIGLNLNPLGRQLAPHNTRSIKFLMQDLLAARPAGLKIARQFIDLADTIIEHMGGLLAKNEISLSDNAKKYLRRTVHGLFHNAWADFSMKFVIGGVGANTTLITGTGGNYPARVISHQFWKNGATVVRTTHGGDVPMFKDYVVPTIEVPFSSTFVVFGENASAAYREQIFARSEATLPMYPGSIEGAGSAAHLAIWERFSTRKVIEQPKRITVIAASFLGVLRAVPHKKVHDVVYLEWHRRLLSSLSTAGYSVLSKRHPKGLLSDQKIFEELVSEESILEPIAAVENRTDVYIIDTAGSALLDALCTNKQVVLIEFPVKIMTPEARRLFTAAAVIVKAEFDERNRITVDMRELDEAINTPVNFEAREKLVNDYFLRPSAGMSSVHKKLSTHA